MRHLLPKQVQDGFDSHHPLRDRESSKGRTVVFEATYEGSSPSSRTSICPCRLVEGHRLGKAGTTVQFCPGAPRLSQLARNAVCKIAGEGSIPS